MQSEKINNIDKNSHLGTEKISSLMVKLALPSILAYVINILYNIVDRIYIGHMASSPSTEGLALTGLGICLPVIQLISAFSAFAGTGGAPLASIELGKSEKNANARKNANKLLGNATFLLIVFSVVLMAVFYFFMTPILTVFGASEATIGYAKDYLSIYLIGTIFVQFSIGLNPFITCQGHAKIAMISILIGAVLNIILDPVFIFTFNMGIKGAALATIISQGVSALWIVLFLTSKKSEIKLTFSNIKPRFSVIKKISSLGFSPFVMQATESAVFVIFNNGLQKYGGDVYVGAMTIMQSVMQIIFVPTMGFSNGVQPIISYNYGAKKIDRVIEVVKKMIVVNCLISLLLVSSATFFPVQFAGIFTSNEKILLLVKRLLPIYLCGMWIMWIQNTAQTTFVGIGNAKVSIIIASLRKIILLIPLALILPVFLGVDGIILAEPIATTTSAVTSAILLFIQLKKFKKMNKKQKLD